MLNRVQHDRTPVFEIAFKYLYQHSITITRSIKNTKPDSAQTEPGFFLNYSTAYIRIALLDLIPANPEGMPSAKHAGMIP
jgi:hypothetical protein